ncbi:MAG: molybdenum transporter ATP-binding protein [Betaproteobacteria bacterium]|nr:molybdenum transporter ATP-binding protein [Betaproteobacteria bacterium]
MLKVDVSKKLANFELDTQFTSDAGITALFGRSGSGKTTLVNVIAGLVRPDRGNIEVNGVSLFDSAAGRNVAIENRRVGYVFQDGRLFPHLTVRGNLDYGFALAAPAQRYVAFEQVVGLLGLKPLLDRRPSNLSGGEKQRVAIGRALLTSPRVLLMDEPLAALDNPRKREILHYIESLHAEIKVPIVYVTHAVEEILRLADVVVLMAAGKVVATGKPSEVMGRPELRADSGIFEGGTVIDAEVVSHDLQYRLTTLNFAGGQLVVPGVDAAPGQSIRLRIRARDVSIALTRPHDVSTLNVLQGRVVSATANADSGCDLQIDVGGVKLAARVTRLSVDRLKLAPGRDVFALIKAIPLAR